MNAIYPLDWIFTLLLHCLFQFSWCYKSQYRISQQYIYRVHWWFTSVFRIGGWQRHASSKHSSSSFQQIYPSSDLKYSRCVCARACAYVRVCVCVLRLFMSNDFPFASHIWTRVLDLKLDLLLIFWTHILCIQALVLDRFFG